MKHDQGVTLRKFYEAWCRKCGWKSEQHSTKYMASFDLAGHNVDRHGGAERIGAEQ